MGHSVSRLPQLPVLTMARGVAVMGTKPPFRRVVGVGVGVVVVVVGGGWNGG